MCWCPWMYNINWSSSIIWLPFSFKFLSSSLIALLLQSKMVAVDSDLESKIASLVDLIAKMEVRMLQAEQKAARLLTVESQMSSLLLRMQQVEESGSAVRTASLDTVAVSDQAVQTAVTTFGEYRPQWADHFEELPGYGTVEAAWFYVPAPSPPPIPPPPPAEAGPWVPKQGPTPKHFHEPRRPPAPADNWSW